MSEQSAGDFYSISDLDLKNPVQLSRSVTQVHNDLVTILTFFARHAMNTPVESTHQIRKKLKFFRAFVKLLKPFHSEEFFIRTNIMLRDFGRLFTELRDAHVRSMMLEEFLSHPGLNTYNINQPDLNTSGLLLQKLDELNQKEIDQLEADLFEPENIFLNFADELEQNELLEHYGSIVDPDPKLVLDSLRISYEKCALSYHLAIESGGAKQLHEWRKRLKDVQYQFELLLKHLSEMQAETYTSVVILCDHLGRVNDIDMLHHWLDEVQPDIQTPSVSGLSQYLSNLIDKLHAKIKDHGIDLYKRPIFKTASDAD